MNTVRVLLSSDPFCPQCGHNRDKSSVSSIDEGDSIKSCQLCGAKWREVEPDATAGVPVGWQWRWKPPHPQDATWCSPHPHDTPEQMAADGRFEVRLLHAVPYGVSVPDGGTVDDQPPMDSEGGK